MSSTVTVVKLAEGKYIGVSAAAKALDVTPQTIYMVMGGYPKALGPEKRRRLRILDWTRKWTRKRSA